MIFDMIIIEFLMKCEGQNDVSVTIYTKYSVPHYL